MWSFALNSRQAHPDDDLPASVTTQKMHSAAFLLPKKLNMCFEEQRQRRTTCDSAVSGDAIKALSAEIVAVLRTPEGAAVVGGMKSSNPQQHARLLPALRHI